MNTLTIPLWEPGMYTDTTGLGFMPALTVYMPASLNPCPAALIIPGGAYTFVSPTEFDAVAMKFLSAGYCVFGLTYTVRCVPQMPPLGIQPLRDAARAVILIRKCAARWNIDPGRVAVCGFSAGGHLAASLAVHWHSPVLDAIADIDSVSPRPDAVVLSYAVLSCGQWGHKVTTENLMGADPDPQALDFFTPDKHVSDRTPPVFLWHTAEDASVPVENTMRFAMAMRAAGLPFELHIFPRGRHGLSSSDAAWAGWGSDMLHSPVGHPSILAARAALTRGGIPPAEQELVDYLSKHYNALAMPDTSQACYVHCAQWLPLCLAWLDMTLAERMREQS